MRAQAAQNCAGKETDIWFAAAFFIYKVIGMETFVSEVLAFKFNGNWHAKRAAIKEELSRLLSDCASRPSFLRAKAYSSLRYDSDVIFWLMSKDPDEIAKAKAAIGSLLDGVASISNGFLSVYKQSRQYEPSHDNRFFVAYPMSKSPEWYLLDEAERKRIVAEHVKVATSSQNNNGISSFTTESFGIGDSEFVVIYELADIAKWVAVTEELRHVEARKWITNERPILVGIDGLEHV